MTDAQIDRIVDEIRILRECNIDTKNQLVELTTRFEAVDSERRRHADVDADIRAAYRIAKWVAVAVGTSILAACTAGFLAAVKFLIGSR